MGLVEGRWIACRVFQGEGRSESGTVSEKNGTVLPRTK
jgi:hypothetical protein